VSIAGIELRPFSFTCGVHEDSSIFRVKKESKVMKDRLVQKAQG